MILRKRNQVTNPLTISLFTALQILNLVSERVESRRLNSKKTVDLVATGLLLFMNVFLARNFGY